MLGYKLGSGIGNGAHCACGTTRHGSGYFCGTLVCPVASQALPNGMVAACSAQGVAMLAAYANAPCNCQLGAPGTVPPPCHNCQRGAFLRARVAVPVA